MSHRDDVAANRLHPSKYTCSAGVTAAVLLFASLSLFGCASPDAQHQSLIKVDGSSTLFSLIETFAEDERKQQNVPIVIGSSGTGSGLNRLCRGELDIATASRAMTPLEQQHCQQAGIEYIQLAVAMDAITVVVHPKNTWIDCISPRELKQMWQVSAQYSVNNWQHVDVGFAKRPLHLYGPGTNSGTYDYFSQTIIGDAHATRGDYAATENDNLTVQGVAGDVNALGFLGMAYWMDNKNKLKALAIRQPDGQCMLPEISNIKQGTYKPLSRSLYLYVNKAHYQHNLTLQYFMGQILNPQLNYRLAVESGFIPVSTARLAQARQQLTQQSGIQPVSVTDSRQVQ
jgi:phosphate transport system substrate-binding protein